MNAVLILVEITVRDPFVSDSPRITDIVTAARVQRRQGRIRYRTRSGEVIPGIVLLFCTMLIVLFKNG